jgi:threonine/homoserine/homoserine lactone efflux protein
MLTMEKRLCWGAIGVAGVVLFLFLLDLLVSFPFGGISPVVDIISILGSGLVLFLAWDALRDLR